jgi:hypothetical protein
MKRVVAFVAIVGLATATARAGETTIGLTLNAVIGAHSESGNLSSTVPLVPVPMFTIAHRQGRFSIALEGLPPIGPVAFSNPAPGTASATKIGMLDGAFRYALPRGRTWIGLGETVINQTTVYAPVTNTFSVGTFVYTNTFTQTDISRVVGSRYEVGENLLSSGNRRLDLQIAVSPTMHARLDQLGATHSSNTRPNSVLFISVLNLRTVETAALIDAQAAWSVKRGRSVLSVGLRYINYAAKFDTGGEADRDRLVLPFLGWSTATY